MQSLELRLCRYGLLALGAGSSIYLFARSAALPSPALSLWMGSLPTLLHTAAFALLSLAVVAPWPRLAPAVCAAWILVESAFEALQLPAVAELTRASAIAPDSTLLRAYLHGTFDPLDIVAAALGALLAGWIAACSRSGAHGRRDR